MSGKGNAVAALVLFGVVGAMALSSKRSSALPTLPPAPGPVPPIPHSTPPAPSPEPAPAPSLPASLTLPPFVEPNGFGGIKESTDKSKIVVGSIVEVDVPILGRALAGPHAFYRVTSVNGDQYTGDLIDPLGLNAGALVGMPNTLSFTSADVLAIVTGATF